MSTDNHTTTITTRTTQRHKMVPRHSDKVRRGGLIAFLCTTALIALMCWAAPAFADYEQATEHFGTTGEAAQLEWASAVAINTTGAGGVGAGTIYVVGYNTRVVRYGPGREGEEPAFEEAWGWGVGDKKEEYERCGPGLATEPTQHTFHTCTPAQKLAPYGGEQPGHFSYPSAVAVDQATGDVYVRNTPKEGYRKQHLIEVFTATGAPVGEGFGDEGRENPLPSESIGEGPEKLHKGPQGSIDYEGLAVDESGVVYVTDRDFLGIANPPGEDRVMSFAPEHEGDYEHYAYTGQAKDFTASAAQKLEFSRIALAGNRIVVTIHEESISEYELGGGNTPICTYLVPGGQLKAMAADPVTGEVFYYTRADEMIHRLGACDARTGQFTVLQAPVALTPETGQIFALAVNPGLSWGVLRPAGVLYGVDSEHGVGDVFVPAKVSAPAIEAESVTGTTVDSTVLHADIDPHGFTTNYRFQYLSASVYASQKLRAEGEGKDSEEVEDAAFTGALEAPAGGSGVLTAGGVGVASAGVGALAANTEYRFRVAASSECGGSSAPACVTVGAAASFSTYPSLVAGLPDGRVYELVSPPGKHGGEVFPAEPRVGSCGEECKPPGSAILARFPMQSSADGDRLVYMGDPFSVGEGAVFNEYLSQRTVSGWQTSDLSPGLQETHSGSVVFDTGLGKDLLYQASPQLSIDAPAGYPNLYLQQAGAASVMSPLIAATPPNRSAVSFNLKFSGASPDVSRAFFYANDVLSGETLFAPEPADPGRSGSDLYEWHEGSLAPVNVLPGNASLAAGAKFASANSAGFLSPDAHGASTDGSRVFWTADGQLYVRVKGEETLEVPGSAGFLAASADGLEVMLSDGTIERFNTETGAYEQAEDLTEGQGGFRGISGIGEEHGQFARIYYVDTQVLLGAGESERGQTAQAAQNNLYVWEAGVPRFIATLGQHDEGSFVGVKDWSAVTVARTAEASPDGEWLAFGSESALTGYDNETAPSVCIAVGSSSGHCAEVFLYDAVSGRLACVSCNPTGEAPRGVSTLRRIDAEPEWLPQPRYLTDSGRLVFDSADRLSAADSNGGVEDVYEYEPDGVGSCVREAGCVVLISPGTGSVDSNFLAMDETGRNVFFTTRERLVPQDKDELIDVYDAREEGGFASQTETQRAECQGEACQNTPVAPVFTTPGSATFSGAGNLLQPLTVAVAPKQRKATSSAQQRRAEALRRCRSQRSKRNRTLCEKRARKSSRNAGRTSTSKREGAKR